MKSSILVPRCRGAIVLTAIVTSIFLSASITRAQLYEAGVLTTNQSPAGQWYDAVFTTPFGSPPVVVLGPLEYNGVNPSTVRVRNVTATGFQFKIDEWDYLDGTHTTESVSYLAIEEGVHQIGGLTWEAGREPSVTQSFRSVSLTGGLPAAPVVMAQIESTNNVQSGSDPTGLVTRLRNASGTGFEVRINDEEASTTGPAGEDIAWVAVEEGNGWLDGQPFLVSRTGDVVASNDADDNGFIEPYVQAFPEVYRNAVVLAAIQTTDGGDPCALRYDGLTDTEVSFFVEEEESADAEVGHTSEDVGFVIIGERRGPDDAKIEVGSLVEAQTDSATWYTVNLQNTYTNPVVVLGPVSQNGGDPSVLRVRNVTATSFEWQLDEWDYLDGGHVQTTQHYIVMEAGIYEIGGLRWEAGVASGITHVRSTVNLADGQPVPPSSSRRSRPTTKRAPSIRGSGTSRRAALRSPSTKRSLVLTITLRRMCTTWRCNRVRPCIHPEERCFCSTCWIRATS